MSDESEVVEKQEQRAKRRISREERDSAVERILKGTPAQIIADELGYKKYQVDAWVESWKRGNTSYWEDQISNLMEHVERRSIKLRDSEHSNKELELECDKLREINLSANKERDEHLQALKTVHAQLDEMKIERKALLAQLRIYYTQLNAAAAAGQ